MTLVKNYSSTHIVILQKLTQALTGLGTAAMVVSFLTPEEQGYFYTIGSLLSSYIIFDLGLSSYLLQRSAQLSTKLEISSSGKIEPDGSSRDHFIAFINWVFKWYRNAGIAAVITLIPIGTWVLSHKSNLQFNINWFWPWILIASAICINMPTIGFFSILEGLGNIRETYLLRSTHYTIGALLSWAFIFMGYGLYAQLFPIVATSLIAYTWYFYKYKDNLKSPYQHKEFEITQSILPQIKYTSSIWLANYIFLNFPIILSFIYGDIVSAGKLGLSILVGNTFGAIIMSKLTSDVPTIIKIAHNGKKSEAKALFKKRFIEFSLYYFLGIVPLICATYLFSNIKIFSRLLSPLEFTLLLITYWLFHSGNIITTYLRAIDKNKITLITLSYVILLMLITIWIGKTGMLNIIFAMLAIYSLILITNLFIMANGKHN